MLAIFYWVSLFLIAIFSGWAGWGPEGNPRWGGMGLLCLLLFLIIGLKVFGFSP